LATIFAQYNQMNFSLVFSVAMILTLSNRTGESIFNVLFQVPCS